MARPRRQTYTMKQYFENVEEGYISNDADTQRNPAWKAIVDGLAVTVLTDDYLPSIILAEEDNGQMHIVDGGSRTAALKMIYSGNYKIKSSVENPIVEYKSMSKDESGKTVWNDAEFDIRNKTYEQFPKELKKKFEEYQIETVIHEHCDKEKIAMYIKRYNEHSAMNANQKMFVYIHKFANKIRKITDRKFFINYSNFTNNEKEKGILERVVSESVMCMFHLDDWNKNGKKIATYLNENSSDKEFDILDNNVLRLENIITEDTKELFNSKDSFIWFTLFNRFTELGLDDFKFGEFLKDFVNGLRNKSVDGKLFDSVDESGSTKDKSVVLDKLHILEALMKEFLHIEENNELVESVSKEEFIAELIDMQVDEVKRDINDYEEDLTDLEENMIKIDSKLRDEENRLSLLAMVAYAYKNDIILDEWLEDYAARTNTYIKDSKRNFYIMVDDLKKYNRKVGIA